MTGSAPIFCFCASVSRFGPSSCTARVVLQADSIGRGAITGFVARSYLDLTRVFSTTSSSTLTYLGFFRRAAGGSGMSEDSEGSEWNFAESARFAGSESSASSDSSEEKYLLCLRGARFYGVGFR